MNFISFKLAKCRLSYKMNNTITVRAIRVSLPKPTASLQIETQDSAKKTPQIGQNIKQDFIKRNIEKLILETPKFNNNADELLNFVNFAEVSLKKRLKVSELKHDLKERINKLKLKKDENDLVEEELVELSKSIEEQRKMNFKLKKSIDQFLNQNYQESVELETLKPFSLVSPISLSFKYQEKLLSKFEKK